MTGLRTVSAFAFLIMACFLSSQTKPVVPSAPGQATPAQVTPVETAPAGPTPIVPPESRKGKNGFRPVVGLENWSYDYDLTGMKPGLYNLLIQGTDSAGNVAEGGPYNIFIDPESDLPVVRISNPSPLMRVGSNLNVVGTCIDDDSVKRVEVRLDGGEWKNSVGKDFWSYLIDVGAVGDGRHKLEARGFDGKELEGKTVSVEFNLDKFKPLITVESPLAGALVSGMLTITGQARDANGVAKVEYSSDSGKTWLPVSSRFEEDKTTVKFDLAADTKKFKDGPTVFWFKATDLVGSVGTSAFLFTVDNTPPEISLMSPAREETVNGSFAVTGRIFDTVGVASLSWVSGKETGDIPLVPGNPYFMKRFDVTGSKEQRFKAVFSVTDITGNVTNLEVDLGINAASDLPVVSILRPAPGQSFDSPFAVFGSVRDDDGISKVVYRFDSGPETEIASNESFVFPSGDLGSGTHTLTVRAIDSGSVPGLPVTVSFVYSGLPPVAALSQAFTGVEERDFFPGIELSALEGKATLKGAVTSLSGLKELTLALGPMPPFKVAVGKPEAGGKFPFFFTLPKDSPFGTTPLELRATDAYDRSSTLRTFVYLTNYSKIRENPGLSFPGAIVDASGRTRLSSDAPLEGIFVGEEIASVEVRPASDIVAASFEGQRVFVRALKEGETPETKIRVVTRKKHSFESSPVRFVLDSSPPTLELVSPRHGAWTKGEISIEGKVQDRGSVRLEYSFDGSAFEVVSESAAPSFRKTVAYGGPDGPVFLSLKATDVSGNVTMRRVALVKDSTPPEIALVSPSGETGAWGKTPFVVRIGENAGSVDTVEFSSDGKKFDRVPAAPFLVREADVSTGMKFVVRVTDKALNVTEKDFGPDIQADPGAKPLLASANERERNNIGSAGEAGASFAVDDASGKAFFASPFRSSASEALDPEAGAGIRVRGALSVSLTLSGIELDPKKSTLECLTLADVKPVQVTRAKRDSPLQASFRLDTSKLPAQDGINVVMFRVSKATGESAFIPLVLDVDNVKPVVAKVLPGPETVNGSWIAAFSLSDSRGLSSAAWETAEDKGTFDISGTTRWFSKRMDILPGGKAPFLSLTVTDGSGNVTKAEFRPPVDPKTDVPSLKASVLEVSEAFPLSVPVGIWATDDDGEVSVSWKADSGPWTDLEKGSGAHAFEIPFVSPGTKVLSFKARDRGGVESAPKDIKVIVKGTAPAVRVERVDSGKTPIPFYQGASVPAVPGSTLVGTVISDNALSELSFEIGGTAQKVSLPARAKDSASYPFTLPLPDALPFGRIAFSVTARDAFGQTHGFLGTLFKVASAPAWPVTDEEGVTLEDGRLSPAGSIVMASGEVLSLRFNGRAVKSAEIVPAQKNVTVSAVDARIDLTAGSEGRGTPFVVRVMTVDGDVFDSKKIEVLVDSAPPEISVDIPATGAWAGNSITVTGKASDPNGIASLEWSTDEGTTWAPIPKVSPAKGDFSFSLPLQAIPDGTVTLGIRAVDGAGKSAARDIALNKDTAVPEIALVTPGTGSVVNGTVSLAGWTQDGGRIAKLEIAADGKTFSDVPFASRGYQNAPSKDPKAAVSPRIPETAFVTDVDFSKFPELPVNLSLRATDLSGNVAVFKPLAPEKAAFSVDPVVDKPVVLVQVPADMEIMRSDFTVAGIAFDDDKVAEIFYRFDSGDWVSVRETNSFGVDVRLADTTDNEHVFEVYAVDVNGVRGDTVSRKYRISKTEPTGALVSPKIELTNKGVIVLEGTASDPNGIEEVFVSFDNGHTFNRAEGQESWKYRLDTRILRDGTYNIQLKMVDKYETTGFFTSLIAVDNTFPVVKLDHPLDGEVFTEAFLVDGRADDSVTVRSLRLEISRLYAKKEEKPTYLELVSGGAFSRVVDSGAFEPGWYNIKVIADDRAENVSYASRDVRFEARSVADKVDIVFPSRGESVSGTLTVDGRLESRAAVSTVTVLSDGQPVGVADVRTGGWFSLRVDGAAIADGKRELSVRAGLPGGSTIASGMVPVSWAREGPSLRFSNFLNGDFVIKRPYLEGTASWVMDKPDPSDAELVREYEKAKYERRLESVEISLDNGRTFSRAQGGETWKFRLETQEYSNGPLYLVARASFADGSTAVRKLVLNVDLRKPVIEILKPGEGGRYNERIAVTGTARDENGMRDVGVTIRMGDKQGYRLPAFIQGSFIDLHLFGATRWQSSIGLSFFDDNVKLQAGIGQGFDVNPSWDNLLGMTSDSTLPEDVSRFKGFTANAKLLANVAYIPFDVFFGPDWSFFSMSFALGADFTMYTMQDSLGGLVTSNPVQVLSSVVAQWEFARITIEEWTVFKSYSFYLEGMLVFIPSEAKPDMRPTVAIGTRIGLF